MQNTSTGVGSVTKILAGLCTDSGAEPWRSALVNVGNGAKVGGPLREVRSYILTDDNSSTSET